MSILSLLKEKFDFPFTYYKKGMKHVVAVSVENRVKAMKILKKPYKYGEYGQVVFEFDTLW